MAKTKANKKKNNDSKNQHSWPNLPQQLLSLYRRQRKLRQSVNSFGGVTKTWRSTPKQCSPDGKCSRWPQLVEIGTKSCNTRVFEIEIDQERLSPPYETRSCTYYCPRRNFKGSSNGILFAPLSYFYKGCLWRPNCNSWPVFPNWGYSYTPINFAAVISTNAINYRAMVLTGQFSHATASSELSRSPNKWKWNLRDYAVKDPYNPGWNMEFCHGIGLGGKFYMMSLQGSLVVVEDTGSGFEVTGVSKSRAMPCNRSRQFREFFVELNGEIMLVFLVSRKSIDVVDDVEVSRLNVSELLWVKVESLGEGTLFVEDECSLGVNAKKIGCRRNCIYFTHSRVSDNLWYVYDMQIGQICPASGGTIDYMKWDEPIDLEDTFNRGTKQQRDQW